MASSFYKLSPLMSALFQRIPHHQRHITHNYQLMYQLTTSIQRCSSNDTHLDNTSHSEQLSKPKGSINSYSNVQDKKTDNIKVTEDEASIDNIESADKLVETSVLGDERRNDTDQTISLGASGGLSSSKENTSDQGEAPKKKKKAPVSEMVKIIRHKKMLEIYQSHRPKSSVPAVGLDSGFKDQLQEYISRHEDKLETQTDNSQQFAVSKTGKVLMFPLNRSEAGPHKEDMINLSDGKEKPPSVTSILNVTRPIWQAMILLKWEKKMIKELGIDGFQEMKQEMFGEGHEVHRAIEQYLQGSPVENLKLSEGVQGYWQSCSDALERINNPAGFEMRVTHSAMGYTGFADCVADVDGKVSLIEWKTSRKLKKNLSQTEDYALQSVAYLGALNFDQNHHKIQVEQVVIVVMYKDGHEATVHCLDGDTCSHYWTKWLGRLLEYHEIAEMKKWFIKGKIIDWNRTKNATAANSDVQV